MKKKLTYQQAGVDIAAADSFVEKVAALARTTHTDGVVPHLAAYASLFRPDLAGIADPLIAATCDGVGTKLLVARQAGRYSGLGEDLVAMNVNDLLPVGARPLLFLDYIATGVLEAAALTAVVSGIAAACRTVGCALIGGETAEMPGLYARGDFDLAGFAVGIADGKKVPDPKSVTPGDVLLALPSTGIHSNGLALARKALLEVGGLELSRRIDRLGHSLADELLIPTALYVEPVLALHARFGFKAAAHVTGGGLFGRLKKLAQPGQRVLIDEGSFARPAIFDLIAECGDVSPLEMAHTFNLGLGFVVVMAPVVAEQALAVPGTPWCRIGQVVAGAPGIEMGKLREDVHGH